MYDDANMGSSQGSVEGPQGTSNRPITPVDPQLHAAAGSGHVDPLTVALTAGSAQRSFSPVGTTVAVTGQHTGPSGSELAVLGAFQVASTLGQYLVLKDSTWYIRSLLSTLCSTS